MIQNIKVDVIYYSTPTDFEMEFNLCGCCRMRLLTDKAETRKDLVHSLSRAVSRSRVIICCGALFGEQGLISNIATAIGKSLVVANNSDFGINSTEEIEIIEGSMPLVCADGTFGGCVIESGPQSIIMLSESKSVRKGLLSTLIHPYIEELSRTPEEVHEDPVAEPIEEPQEEPVAEVTEVALDEEPIEELSEIEELEIEQTEEPQEEDTQVPNADTSEEPMAEPEVDFTEVAAEPQEPTQNHILNPINDVIFDTDTSEDDIEYQEPTQDGFDLFSLAKEEESDEAEDEEDFSPPLDTCDSFILEPSEPFNMPLKLPILIISIIVAICAALLIYLLVITPLFSGQSFSENIKNMFSPAVINFISLH